MADLVEEIMPLWQGLPASDAEAEAKVGRYYADPVVVNGTPVSVADMTKRARNLQRSLTGIRHELLERVEQGDKLVIAFVLRATHTGPWQSPVGEVPASGQEVAARTIDVLTVPGRQDRRDRGGLRRAGHAQRHRGAERHRILSLSE